jgi:cyanophycin synthetase
MEESFLHKKSKCAYCGDAPVNHTMVYVSGVLAVIFDNSFSKALSWAPTFFVRFIDKMLGLCLHTLVLLRVIKLSSDPERSTTLRSRVMWNEAKKRGIPMEQLIIFGKYTDNYRAKVNGKYIYFNSLPVNGDPESQANQWDDKFYLKTHLSGNNIPVPRYSPVPIFRSNLKKFFESFEKPLIVKPRLGSRGRHTTTNIKTFAEFERAVEHARMISPQIVAEEYLEGYVCRATCVDGKLQGFYRAEGAVVIGDGKKSVSELIKEKNKNRGERIEEVNISAELIDFISRRGFTLESVPPKGEKLYLSHRTGRFFGGKTREMIDDLHPSFVPILERAAKTVSLPVSGFDCIIPEPENDAASQRWGIIECNTLPFIDLHYYALEGEPRNIAGHIWDLVC